MEDTWFQLPSQHSIVCTSRGTRPGDNLADILFSLVFSDVLTTVRCAVEESERHQQLPWVSSMHRTVCQVVPDDPERLLSMHEATWPHGWMTCVLQRHSLQQPSSWPPFVGLPACSLTPVLPRECTPTSRAIKLRYSLTLQGVGARKLRSDRSFGHRPGSRLLLGTATLVACKPCSRSPQQGRTGLDCLPKAS